MNHQGQVGQAIGYQGSAYPTPEATRAIPNAMSEFSVCVGELDTAVRALAARIAPVIPGGDPFNSKVAEGAVTGSVRAAKSSLCEEIDARTYKLREITKALQDMASRVEI